MADHVVLTDDNFDQTVKKADGLVLVDFYADWCMPCRMLAPILDQVAADYEGKVTVAKLDVDKNSSTAASFSISGIPTVMLFKAGDVLERLTGLQTADALKGIIDKHLA